MVPLDGHQVVHVVDHLAGKAVRGQGKRMASGPEFEYSDSPLRRMNTPIWVGPSGVVQRPTPGTCFRNPVGAGRSFGRVHLLAVEIPVRSFAGETTS